MEEFLFVFLKTFNAKPINIKYNNGIVSGNLIWLDDDDEDSFEWECKLSDEVYSHMTYILRSMQEKQFIKGDKILKSKKELLDILFSGSEDYSHFLNELENIKVYFIEDGMRSDRLFLHY